MKYIVLFCMICIVFCQQPPNNTETHLPVNQLVDPTPEPRFVRQEGQIKYGDTLERVLLRHDIDRKTALELIDAFASHYDVRRIKPGHEYSVLYDTTSIIQGFEYQAAKEQKIRVLKDSCGTFHSKAITLPLDTTRVALEGMIHTSLYDAILEQGESPELMVMFSDIFQWDLDFFTDPRKGDRFKILYEKVKLADEMGEFIRYGRIYMGQYISQDTTLTAVYFDNHPQKSGYYDTRGRSFQKAYLKSPLNYRRISSSFSSGRRHPILKIVRPHHGVDFAAALGTPVSAAGDGVIIDKGYNKGLGNFIKIRHKNPRHITVYGHLNGFAKGIKKGVQVKQRDVIGFVGKTGLATGPHLHYGFYDNGRPINPLRIKNVSGDPILDKNRERFTAECQVLLRELQKSLPMVHQDQMREMGYGE
jgi:murein DD-endopeptidase MepM/ murein hydrolase activator NlpD